VRGEGDRQHKKGKKKKGRGKVRWTASKKKAMGPPQRGGKINGAKLRVAECDGAAVPRKIQMTDSSAKKKKGQGKAGGGSGKEVRPKEKVGSTYHAPVNPEADGHPGILKLPAGNVGRATEGEETIFFDAGSAIRQWGRRSERLPRGGRGAAAGAHANTDSVQKMEPADDAKKIISAKRSENFRD